MHLRRSKTPRKVWNTIVKKMCFSVPENLIKKGKELAKRRSRRNSSNGDEKEKRGLLSEEVDKWKMQQQQGIIPQENHDTFSNNPTYWNFIPDACKIVCVSFLYSVIETYVVELLFTLGHCSCTCLLHLWSFLARWSIPFGPAVSHEYMNFLNALQ